MNRNRITTNKLKITKIYRCQYTVNQESLRDLPMMLYCKSRKLTRFIGAAVLLHKKTYEIYRCYYTVSQGSLRDFFDAIIL